MGIREKMTAIVAAITILSTCIVTGISLYGMNGTSDIAIQHVNEIGEQSSKNSSALLEEQKKKELVNIAASKAEDIDQRLGEMETVVKLIASAMHNIYANSQDFSPRTMVPPPPTDGAGKITFYLQCAPDIDIENMKYEIDIAANIQYPLMAIVEQYPWFDSAFVASKNNYTLSSDNNTETLIKDYVPPGLYYDAVHTDWYQTAVTKKSVTFTDVRQYVFSKEMGIFCSTPYYNTSDEIEGVVGLEATLGTLNKLIAEVSTRNEVFCFVIDKNGRVVLSSDNGINGNYKELSFDLETDRRNSQNRNLSEALKRMVIGEENVCEVEIDGRECYMAYAPIQHAGWSVGVVTAKKDVMAPIVMNNDGILKLAEENVQELNSHVQSIIIINIAITIFAIWVMLIVGKVISKHFVEPIRVLADSVCEISEGNLNKKIDIHTGDEIEYLAECFNDMTTRLKKSMDSISKMSEERERQNIALRKKNAELSKALKGIAKLRADNNIAHEELELDELTGLCNKDAMERICTETCKKLPEGRQAALYAVNLDHFKEVNETRGDEFSNKVLIEYALQLKLLCRESDCVGRFGDNEFVVMMTGTLTGETIQRKANDMLQAARNLRIDGILAGITASVGVAVAPLHGLDYHTLFKVAEKALIYVKDHGRNNFSIGQAL